MSGSVKLDLPVSAPYRPMAIELARKYVELRGGSPADAAAAADALGAALERAAAAAAPGASVGLTFTYDAAGVEMQVRCGAAADVVRQAVPHGPHP